MGECRPSKSRFPYGLGATAPAHQLYYARPDRPSADGPVITVDVDAIIPDGCLMVITTYVGPDSYDCGGVTAFEIEGTNQRISVVSD